MATLIGEGCVYRARIDCEGPPRYSLLHKVWEGGLVEFYKLVFAPSAVGVSRIEITEAEWNEHKKRAKPYSPWITPTGRPKRGRPPKIRLREQVEENSDWQGA